MCVIHVVIVALSCTLFRLITEMQMESHRGITVSFFLFSFFFFLEIRAELTDACLTLYDVAWLKTVVLSF